MTMTAPSAVLRAGLDRLVRLTVDAILTRCDHTGTDNKLVELVFLGGVVKERN